MVTSTEPSPPPPYTQEPRMGAEKEENLTTLAETNNSYVFQQLHVPISKIRFVVDKHA